MKLPLWMPISLSFVLSIALIAGSAAFSRVVRGDAQATVQGGVVTNSSMEGWVTNSAFEWPKELVRLENLRCLDFSNVTVVMVTPEEMHILATNFPHRLFTQNVSFFAEQTNRVNGKAGAR